MNYPRRSLWIVFFLGFISGMLLVSLTGNPSYTCAHAAPKESVDLTKIAAELEIVKGKLTDQSHVMQDVAYHFTNLWFAGQQKNWPLANFYEAETKSHLHWAVRVIPKRKDLAGRDIDLVSILQAVENTELKNLEKAIATRDSAAFEQTYRATLVACYTCHKSANKEFLRPQIPTRPEASIINFDPTAKWPQ